MADSIDIQKLIDVLKELRSASLQINTNPTENNVKALMHKYDMLFLGEKFNHIYSLELCHTLKNHFNLDVDNNTLNKLIPLACKSLNMQYNSLVYVANIGKSTADCYEIILW